MGGDGDGQRVLDLGSDDILDALFASEIGVALVDRDLRFVRINAALAAMNGLPAERHFGHRVDEIVPGVADAAGSAIETVLRTGQPVFVLLEGQTAAAPSVRRRWAGQYIPIGSHEPVAVLALVHELDHDRDDTPAARRSRRSERAPAIPGRLRPWEWDADAGGTFDVPDRTREFARMKAQTSALAALNEASTELHRERDRDAVARAIPSGALRVCDGDYAVFAVRDNAYAPWTVDATVGALPPSWDPARHVTVLRDGAAHDAASPHPTELVAVLPPDTHGESLGAIVVGRRRGRFTSTEREVLASLALHAAAALENAALHASAAQQIARREHALEERDRVARILQASLLPPELPSIPGVDVAAAYRPRAGDIGGDFYDVFPVRGRAWGVALGDVCGKGPEAAATTALARHTLRAAAMTFRPPRRILATLNEVLVGRNDDGGRFLTAVFLRLETSEDGARLTAAIAGHPPVVVLRDDGTVEHHGPTGRLLGVFDDAALRDIDIELRAGDSCIVYTDGATDVRHGRDVFGDERLAEVVAGCRGMSAAGIASSVQRAVVDFQDGEVEDDLALVVIAMPPPGA